MIDCGEFTQQQAEVLFNGTDTKTMSMFMKLRAQEEIRHIKVLSTT
jgi:hypothetical protein